MLKLIAAADRAYGIGKQNALPFKLSDDMAFFKRMTSGSIVVMGRKTFDSIGRPLPNRTNIVLTRDGNWHKPDVWATGEIQPVIDLSNEFDVWVIGGSEIYAQFLPYASQIYLTEVDAELDCDTFFPCFDKSLYRVETLEEHEANERNQFGFAIRKYSKEDQCESV